MRTQSLGPSLKAQRAREDDELASQEEHAAEKMELSARAALCAVEDQASLPLTSPLPLEIHNRGQAPTLQRKNSYPSVPHEITLRILKAPPRCTALHLVAIPRHPLQFVAAHACFC